MRENTQQQPFDRIPAEMRAMRHWVCWQKKPNPKSHSGISKLPINPKTGGNAQANNPETWSDFATACTAARQRGLAGIGFMFNGSGLFGVDVDDRPLDAPEVQEILAGLPSYAERSQSGKGIHIICKGALPGEDFNNRTEGIEMYSERRFFVVTGDACTDRTELVDCSEAVKPFYDRYKTHKQQQPAPAPRAAAGAAPVLNLDAQQVITKAQSARNGSKFAALYAGDITGYNSQSEADIAFCNLLAFWTGRNAALMDEIYRSSGLMRDKWNRRQSGSTYGAITIQQAIADCKEAYGERRQIETDAAYYQSIGRGSLQPLDWNDEIIIEQPGALDPNEPQSGAALAADPATVPAAAPTAEPGQDPTQQAAAAPQAAPQQQPPLPGFFYYSQRDELRVDPAKLHLYIRSREHYIFVASAATDGVRRFWYNPQRGVYEWSSDEQIKARIRSYIDRYEPTAAKTRDINEVFNLLCLDDCRIPDSKLDSDEALINFRNGFYNIRTGEMMPHSSGIYSTIQLDLDFKPGRSYTLADAPAFSRYLADLTDGDPERQQLLLEYIGACLSNVHGYRYKRALFIVGAPDAGKSQIVKLIAELLGERNYASISFQDLDERFQNSAAYGKRLVCDPDMQFMRAKSNKYFMWFTGGDKVGFEFKGLNHFSAVYKGFLLFASNKMPKWGGNTSEAAYNRMLVIRCDNSIPESRRDPDLLAKMLREREAIAGLAIAALQSTIRNGYRFTRPAQVDSTLAELRRGNSPAVAFYEDCCTIWPDADRNIKHCTKRSDMYAAFRTWCRDNSPGYMPTRQQFAADIMQYLKMPEQALIRIKDGIRYYIFALTGDAKEDLHQFDALQ